MKHFAASIIAAAGLFTVTAHTLPTHTKTLPPTVIVDLSMRRAVAETNQALASKGFDVECTYYRGGVICE
jgi:hypothetical protein